MKLDLMPELNTRSTVSDLGFVFDDYEEDRRALITRFRGTACSRSEEGFSVAAWQKSVYRFGGIRREVPLAVVLQLDPCGNVIALELDDRCRGSQGRRCDFQTLQACMREKLLGESFLSFSSACPNAGAARCLHLFELLSGASDFFAVLQKRGLQSGSEQELVTITPNPDGLSLVNRHIVLENESTLQVSLRHIDPPRRGDHGLIQHLNAVAEVSHQGCPDGASTLKAEPFEDVYTALNMLFGRYFQQEKKALELPGNMRLRFTNFTAFAGLLLLTLCHESMHGTVSRILRIEKILHDLQTGDNHAGCIGFGG